MKNHIRYGLTLLLSAILILSPEFIFQLSASSMLKPSSHQEFSSESIKEASSKLERMFQSLEKEKKDFPRDTFDPEWIVEKMNRDPVKLFDWVHDNTFLVPYYGLLRGPQGVLMDRLGNSLDRAMLLYWMLKEAGLRTRLAHGNLSEKQANDLLTNIRPIPKEGALPVAKTDQQTLRKLITNYAKQYNMSAEKIFSFVQDIKLQQKRLFEEAIRRTQEQAQRISAAVNMEMPNIMEQKKTEQTTAIDAFKDHWWVQYKDEEKWIDLDPTFPKEELGRTWVEADKTLQPENFNEIIDSCHYVRIRIILEFWKNERLVEVEALNTHLFPQALLGMKITLQHVPPQWPQNLNFFKEKNPVESMKRTVLAQREWLPVISIDSDIISKYSFLTDSDNLYDSSLPNWAQAALAGRKSVDAVKEGSEKTGNRIGDLLRARSKRPLGDKTQEAEKPKKTHLTAEWIEYEIFSPGQETQKIRRKIFDLLGQAVRSGGMENVPEPEITEAQKLERGFALFGETEILPLVCHLSPQFIEYIVITGLLDNRTFILNLLHNAEIANDKILTDLNKDFKPLPTRLYSLAMARHEWSRLKQDIYLDSINIFSYHNMLKINENREPVLLESYDIVANKVAVHLAENIDPFLIRCEQGVTDANIEALLASEKCIMGDCTPLQRKVENTAELFASSKEQKIEWLTVRNTDDPAWEKIEMPGDFRTQIELDLAYGYVVIVPERAVNLENREVYAWWRVDPNTGNTIGIGEHGWGQAATEEKLLEKQLVLSVILAPKIILICGVKAALDDNPGVKMLVCAFGRLCFLGALIISSGTAILAASLICQLGSAAL
jgi:hypothetical protein